MQQGPDGFRDFVVARSPALARTAYLLTGDRFLAEDLVQEALTRVASRWAKVSAGGDPEPYVRRVLYTCAVDGWRRRRPREVPLSVDRATGRDDAEQATQRLALAAALAKLTPKQRAVLVLRFFEDLTEVADGRGARLLGQHRQVADPARPAAAAGAVAGACRLVPRRPVGGRSMSTDLRGLLRDLADSVPYTGRRHRPGRPLRTRPVAVAGGVRHVRDRRRLSGRPACSYCSPRCSLGSSPLAAQYGSSAGSQRLQHTRRHVGHQFPVLGLPRRPGPAAGLMHGPGTGWYLAVPERAPLVDPHAGSGRRS